MAVQIVFETHAISLDNERGIATGWLPGTLSKRGRELARDMGRRRLAEPVTVVFSSDLQRAVETAHLAFGESGVPIHTDARLRECNYGDLNGLPVSQLEAQRSAHLDVAFPNGESYREAVQRLADFLRELAARWDGASVVLVGHSVTRWALDHLITGVPLQELIEAPFAWQPGWRYVLEANRPPPAQGARVEWQAVPEHVRQHFEDWAGSPVAQAVTQPSGFSPGVAARLRLEDGRRLFVKAIGSEPNPDSPTFHRREARIVRAMPPNVPVPRLLWFHDEGEGGWVVLAFE
jgi:broad specificity phosphatase PhoE